MSTTLAPVERTYSRAAAAERLGLSRATLARWAVQGRGPRYSRTGDVRGKAIDREADLIAWLESRKQQATAGASHGTR